MSKASEMLTDIKHEFTMKEISAIISYAFELGDTPEEERSIASKAKLLIEISRRKSEGIEITKKEKQRLSNDNT